MKPIKPYADYYITADIQNNCRTYYNNWSTTCRYIRKSGDNCNKLDQTYSYTDSNFSNRYITTSSDLGSNPQIIMTNCSNLSTNNYNPGVENIAMTNFATTIAIAIVLVIIYAIIKMAKGIPPLWR